MLEICREPDDFTVRALSLFEAYYRESRDMSTDKIVVNYGFTEGHPEEVRIFFWLKVGESGYVTLGKDGLYSDCKDYDYIEDYIRECLYSDAYSNYFD